MSFHDNDCGIRSSVNVNDSPPVIFPVNAVFLPLIAVAGLATAPGGPSGISQDG